MFAPSLFTKALLLNTIPFFADHRSFGPLGKDTGGGHWQTGFQEAKKNIGKCEY